MKTGAWMQFSLGVEQPEDPTFGRIEVTLWPDGELLVAGRQRGAQAVWEATLGPNVMEELRVALRRGGWPRLPNHTIISEETLAVLEVRGAEGVERAAFDYYTGMRLSGYRDLLRRLYEVSDYLIYGLGAGRERPRPEGLSAPRVHPSGERPHGKTA
ncbi:hypothetical protein L6R49_15010 [Myxococcota bacterium]|nr:hypothetical protein [Myxococcota bacterium]